MQGLLLLSVLLSLIAGSALDTGSVCLVRAVNESIAGRPVFALGCLMSLLTAGLVFYMDSRLGWSLRAAPWAWPTARVIGGAALFAAGAVLNGACAAGTITRLSRGDLGYLATLAGALVATLLVPRTMLPVIPAGAGSNQGLVWLAVIVLVTVLPTLFLRGHLSRRVILSYAALGTAAAILANLQGDWTWLKLFRDIQAGVPLRAEIIVCLAAVLTGATATAMFRRHFHIIRPSPRTVLRETVAGGMMAVGALLIPGGNEALLVYSLPSGSPHAVAALVVIVAVTLALLSLSRAARGWGLWPGP